MKPDYYKILGITDEEKKLEGKEFDKVLKKRFRAIAIKNHPDKLGDIPEAEKKKAEETFKKASEAYEVLSDPEKRKQYDLGGSDFSYTTTDFGGMNFDDLFNHFAEFGGGFDPFGFGGRRQQTTPKGSSIRLTFNLSLKEMQQGVTKKVRYKRFEVCSNCGGSGMTSETRKRTCKTCGGTGMVVSGNTFVQMRQTCPTCGGQGYVLENPCKKCNGHGLVQVSHETELKIAPGVFDGMDLVYKGLGNLPPHGKGESGDLIIHIVQVGKSEFTRDGNNIIFEMEIPIVDAIIGCTKTIASIDGKQLSVKIPPFTNDGDQLRFKGYGMPQYGNPSVVGDLIGVARLKMPKALNKKEKELLYELKKQANFKQ